MGCLFYGFLSRDKFNEVYLVGKNRSKVNSIKKNGIYISGISTLKIKNPSILSNTKNIGIADIVIILVKSYDTQSAVKKALPCINHNTTILTLQNGLGNLEVIKKLLRTQRIKSPVVVGSTSHAALVVSSGRIVHTGVGETIIAGKDLSSVKKVKWLLENAGLTTKISNNYLSVLWSKLLINASINPVGTIFNLTNGEILKNEFACGIMVETAKEIAEFCKAKRIKLLYRDPVKKVISVCKKTARNKNSMLQDFLNSKKTEIDFLNGAILQEAKFKYHLPYNRLLFNTIKYSFTNL